ncbi:MFS transporter [Roseinatronobacter sp. S2]|uniref:MFS transporter n=1 Tax=Roseinatronobacter sp. S2 TaxID=3035471 RepID=UPI00240F50FF|nr:MFS transporter [Roseinatronobacter sp. S2]WFE75791.1 hypothetical protein P8S53_05135 [Roseinatronobacter sp. S2]
MRRAAIRQSFAVAYIAAAIGMPAAFFTIALPTFMRDGGASLMEIGLTWIVWLPSALKWLWAPWVGQRAFRNQQSRTRWLMGLCTTLALCFLPVVWLVEGMAIVPLLALSLLSAAIGVTIQMVMAGWQISTRTEAARARLNGWAVAGMVVGGVAGGGLMPVLAVHVSWTVAVPLLSVLIAFAALPAHWLEGDTGTAAETTTLQSFSQVLKAPGRGRVLIIILLLAGSSGADMSIPARLIDAGLPTEKVLILLGTVATLLAVPAGLLTGFAMARWGWPMVLGMLLLAKAGVYMLLAFGPSADGIFGVADFVLAGALTVATWQCYMAASRDVVPVTHYGVLTSLDAAIRFCAGMTAAIVATSLGYPGMFCLFAILSILAAVVVGIPVLTGLQASRLAAPFPRRSR